MLTKRRKLIFIVCVLVGLLVCGLGCVSLTRSFTLKGNPNDLPVESFTVIMELNQREEFFTQMQKFADNHALMFALLVHSPDKESFAIQIDGDGFFITAVGTTPREINIGFYHAPNSSALTSQETVDELMDDIKHFVNEIPSVMITERRHRLIIIIDKNWRDEELFSQMEALAEKHSLEYKLSFYGSDPSDRTCFLVEIQGEGFHIISDCHLNTLDKINIDLYLDYYKTPTIPSQETLDELFVELKNLLSEIPNVAIIEEK